MTSEERAAVIAEKVMGWVYLKQARQWAKEAHPGAFVPLISRPEFDPDQHIAQALEALEKWRAGHEERDWKLQSDGTCLLAKEIPDTDDFEFIEKREDTLQGAIVSALIEAIQP